MKYPRKWMIWCYGDPPFGSRPRGLEALDPPGVEKHSSFCRTETFCRSDNTVTHWRMCVFSFHRPAARHAHPTNHRHHGHVVEVGGSRPAHDPLRLPGNGRSSGNDRGTRFPRFALRDVTSLLSERWKRNRFRDFGLVALRTWRHRCSKVTSPFFRRHRSCRRRTRSPTSRRARPGRWSRRFVIRPCSSGSRKRIRPMRRRWRGLTKFVFNVVFFILSGAD